MIEHWISNIGRTKPNTKSETLKKTGNEIKITGKYAVPNIIDTLCNFFILYADKINKNGIIVNSVCHFRFTFLLLSNSRCVTDIPHSGQKSIINSVGSKELQYLHDFTLFFNILIIFI